MATHVYTGTARASAALPAAGAYDLAPESLATNNYNEFTPMFSYTRGGAAGSVTYKVEISNDKTNWYQISEMKSGTLAAGSDTVDLLQRAEITYTATSASAENFTGPTFTVAANWFRIVCKESGNAGAPGTVSVIFYTRGDL